MNKDRNKPRIRVADLASPEAAAQYVNYWEKLRPDFQFIQAVPYINQHFGEVQIVARIGNGEGETKEFKGFDAHCDSLNSWTLRVIDKLPLREEDDISLRRSTSIICAKRFR